MICRICRDAADRGAPPEAHCTCCGRPIPAWARPRLACVGCQQILADRLAELPGLYDALDPAPGRGAPAVGSRRAAGSRPPIDLTVVDLTGRRGILVVLTGWMRVWHEDGAGDLPDWPLVETEQVAAACSWLRFRLDWAARQHPAVDEAIREISEAWRQVRTAATRERGERPITVACATDGCGGRMRITLSTPGQRCGVCGTQYGWTELRGLQPVNGARADRAAA